MGDASGLQPAGTVGNLYISLHTADPGASGNQTTNEAAYTGYARVAVARTGGQWSVSSPQVSNVNAITFPACSGGSETELYWGIGTASSGAGNLLYSGVIGAPFEGFTAATSGNITVPGNTFSVNDRVAFFSALADWTFPTGITQSTVYWVKTVAGDVITISATMGGSAVTISAAGTGNCAKVVPFAVSSGITPQIPASSLVLIEN